MKRDIFDELQCYLLEAKKIVEDAMERELGQEVYLPNPKIISAREIEEMLNNLKIKFSGLEIITYREERTKEVEEKLKNYFKNKDFYIYSQKNNENNTYSVYVKMEDEIECSIPELIDLQSLFPRFVIHPESQKIQLLYGDIYLKDYTIPNKKFKNLFLRDKCTDKLAISTLRSQITYLPQKLQMIEIYYEKEDKKYKVKEVTNACVTDIDGKATPAFLKERIELASPEAIICIAIHEYLHLFERYLLERYEEKKRKISQYQWEKIKEFAYQNKDKMNIVENNEYSITLISNHEEEEVNCYYDTRDKEVRIEIRYGKPKKIRACNLTKESLVEAITLQIAKNNNIDVAEYYIYRKKEKPSTLWRKVLIEFGYLLPHEYQEKI